MNIFKDALTELFRKDAQRTPILKKRGGFQIKEQE